MTGPPVRRRTGRLVADSVSNRGVRAAIGVGPIGAVAQQVGLAETQDAIVAVTVRRGEIVIEVPPQVVGIVQVDREAATVARVSAQVVGLRVSAIATVAPRPVAKGARGAAALRNHVRMDAVSPAVARPVAIARTVGARVGHDRIVLVAGDQKVVRLADESRARVAHGAGHAATAAGLRRAPIAVVHETVVSDPMIVAPVPTH